MSSEVEQPWDSLWDYVLNDADLDREDEVVFQRQDDEDVREDPKDHSSHSIKSENREDVVDAFESGNWFPILGDKQGDSDPKKAKEKQGGWFRKKVKDKEETKRNK